MSAAARISARYQPNVRASRAGRPASQMAPSASSEAGHVGEDVAGIREERQAVGGDAADDLDHEDRERQAQHDDERAPVLPGRAADVVRRSLADPGGVGEPDRDARRRPRCGT